MRDLVKKYSNHELIVNLANTGNLVGSAAGAILLVAVPVVGGTVLTFQMITSAAT